nr:hypothetical protein [Kineococcus indalonis]
MPATKLRSSSTSSKSRRRSCSSEDHPVPKSSMLSQTPICARCCSVRRLSADSLIATVSVISTVSAAGGRSCSASSASTRRASSVACRLVAERFTAMRTRRPARHQPAVHASASRSTQVPSAGISPCCSASGRPGGR